MKKAYFWPVAMIVMGLVILAQNLGMLSAGFGNFWPLVLVVVGLGGVLTADREEWYNSDQRSKTKKSKKKK